MKTTSYLKVRNRHFCQHLMRRTIQQTFSAIILSSQQKTTKLFFSSRVRKQFKLLAVPFKSLRCYLRSDKLVNCHVEKFYKDLFLNCRVSSSPDLSIKSYFLMVSSPILLRSLRVYTAISRTVVGKMCTRQSRKVIWDMINTLFLTTVPVEPTFVAFL